MKHSNISDYLGKLKQIVIDHYEAKSTPLLLSRLGAILRKKELWPIPGAEGKTLKHVIGEANDPDLQIVRDQKFPAFIAVTTEAAKEVVEQSIERRHRRVSHIPDLEALPRSVVLAFCVKHDAGGKIFLSIKPPFKYCFEIPEEDDPSMYVPVDDKYRRPGLKFTNINELEVLDHTDLQSKIATWSLDKGISLELFYKAVSASPSNALERLIAAQQPGISEKLMIPSDIALFLSRQR